MDLKSIRDLMHRDVDRKEFLAYIAAAVVALTGIAGVIKSLTDIRTSKSSPKVAGTYGAFAYGGRRKLGTIRRRLD